MKALKMTAAAFILAMLTAVTAQAGLLEDQHPHSNFAIGGAEQYEMEGTMERESN